jgi:hypothetical protein
MRGFHAHALASLFRDRASHSWSDGGENYVLHHIDVNTFKINASAALIPLPDT